jgi:SPP1 gp7 family putative phage head morphogenesis protein
MLARPEPRAIGTADQEAIALFKAKSLNRFASYHYLDVRPEDHAVGFTAAKISRLEVADALTEALKPAIAGEITFADFQKSATPTLQKLGWWGRSVETDPLTGEQQVVQLGSERRLKVIFDTNIRTARSAARWHRVQRTKADLPWLLYVAVMDDRTRDEHKAWHYILLPVDHPFWSTHWPPNGWFCRCMVRQLSDAQVSRMGLSPSSDNDVAQFMRTKPFAHSRLVDAGGVPFTIHVPDGIDPTFAHNHGAVALEQHMAQVLAEKVAAAPPELAAPILSASTEFLGRHLTAGFARWVDDAVTLDAAGLPVPKPSTGSFRVLGPLGDGVLAALAERGVYPASGVVTMRDADIAHIFRDKHRRDGIMVPLEDIRQLPQHLASPKRALWDRLSPRPTIILLFEMAGDPRAAKVVIQIGFDTKRPPIATRARHHVRTNSVITSTVVEWAEFTDKNKYDPID